MRKTLFAGIVLALIMVAGCKKETDNTTNWVGTYHSTGTVTDSVNLVTISKVDNNTLNVQLQVSYNGLPITFVNLTSVKVNSSTTSTVDETGTILGSGAQQYHFSGSLTLSGSTLTMLGSGTNVSNAADVRGYGFIGSK